MKYTLVHRFKAVLFALVLLTGMIPAHAAMAAGGSVTALWLGGTGSYASDTSITISTGQLSLGWDAVTPEGNDVSYSSVDWAGGGSAPGISSITWSSDDGAQPGGAAGSIISFVPSTSSSIVPPNPGAEYTVQGHALGTVTLTVKVGFTDGSSATDTLTVTVTRIPDAIAVTHFVSIGHDTGSGNFTSGDFSVAAGDSTQVQLFYAYPAGVTITAIAPTYDSSLLSLGSFDLLSPGTYQATLTGLKAGETTLGVTLTYSDGAQASNTALVTVTDGGIRQRTLTSDTGIISVSGALPDTVELVTSPFTQGPVYNDFKLLVGNVNLLALYDIKLVDTATGADYQVPAGTTISVTIIGDFPANASNLKIAHQKEDGSLEYITPKMTNSYTMTFSTTSFSLYGVISDKSTTDNGNQPAPGKTDNNQTTSNKTGKNQPAPLKTPLSSSSGSGSKSGSSSNLPQTGDGTNANTAVVVGLSLLITAGVLELAWKRRFV